MAVINVTPQMDITALIASNNVNEGDIFLLEEGIYFQAVNVSKNYIRIIAKGPGVILYGKGTLSAAFTLSDVTGVAIEGIKIRHYSNNGILIESGSGNRIVDNKINNMISDGIAVVSSSGNIVWKNEICKCLNGVSLTLDSTSNWVIENIAKNCRENGFRTFLGQNNNNAFISNISTGNKSDGFDLFGSNNLLLDNISMNNAFGILIDEGRDSLAIGNKSRGIKFGPLTIVDGYRNYFAGENHMVCNRRKGMDILGQFGIFINNEVSYNTDNGMELTSSSAGNLVMDNKLIYNIPKNIVNEGTDNNIINNMDKPYEPCESPMDFCGDCPGEGKEVDLWQ